MKMKKIITTVLAVLFVLFLTLSVGLSALCAACSPKAVERRLERNGFYPLAVEAVKTEVGNLESIIGIPTADIVKVIPDATIEALLKPYVLATAEQLLRGGEAPQATAFTSDALYTLVCTVITAEQYNNDTVQMEEDRMAAYEDLTAAVNDTLTFFPTSLFDTAMEILASKQQVEKLYATIAMIRKLLTPTLLLTALCGGGLVFYRQKELFKAIKLVAGCWAITGSVLFFGSLFTLAGNHLLDKFGLSDGLLRRFVLALFENAASSILTATAICFTLGILLLAAVIAVIAVKTSCTKNENVVE